MNIPILDIVYMLIMNINKMGKSCRGMLDQVYIVVLLLQPLHNKLMMDLSLLCFFTYGIAIILLYLEQVIKSP
jgi:hypothetical protein